MSRSNILEIFLMATSTISSSFLKVVYILYDLLAMLNALFSSQRKQTRESIYSKCHNYISQTYCWHHEEETLMSE